MMITVMITHCNSERVYFTCMLNSTNSKYKGNTRRQIQHKHVTKTQEQNSRETKQKAENIAAVRKQEYK